MVDAMQFKQQNQEVQQGIIMEIPKIRCKEHQNSKIKLINLNTSSSNHLVCMTCVVLNKIQPEQLVLMKEIFTENKSQIIKNWPPQLYEELYSQLNSKEVQESKTNELILQINSYFDNFKQDILIAIDDHKKKIVSHINIMEDYRQNVIEAYNEVSQKEEIRKQISENQNDLNELEKQLRTTISTKQKSFKLDQQRLQDSLNDLIQFSQRLDLNNIKNHFEQVLQTLKSIQILNSNQKDTPTEDVNDLQQSPVIAVQQQESSEVQQVNQITLITEELKITSIELLKSIQNLIEYQNINIDLQQSFSKQFYFTQSKHTIY